MAVVYLTERWLPLVRERVAPAKPVVPVGEPMPHDLLALVAQESEPWARDQIKQTLQEHYDETRDWNAVRRRMGV